MGTNHLAYLILEYLADQDEPYVAFSKGKHKEKLPEQYRDVINTGVYSYQIHYYLILVERFIGVDNRWLVRATIQDILKKNEGGDIELGNALNLISSALSIGSYAQDELIKETFASQELSIAISFMLGLPNSPHYAHSTSLREEEIHHMDHELEWKFVEYLSQGREAVEDNFAAFLHLHGAKQKKSKQLYM